MRRCIDVQPRIGLVENGQLRREHAIWKISFFFFSPPEKPSFTERDISFGSSSTTALFSFIKRRN